PAGLAVEPDGSRVYVVDSGGVNSESHRVRAFDAASGEHLNDIGKRGSGPGELNLPRDVTRSPDGNLYVVDGGNFRVQVFKPDGTFVRVFGGIGRQGGQFSRPKEIAADKDGNVYVIDAAFGNFQIFNGEGSLLLAIGSRAEKDGVAKYMLPSGIGVDGDGRVYMVDQYFRKVDVFRPAALGAKEGFGVPPAAPAK
ncbi:MAG TPA: 6-bladed beta-propeller, partial [Telluria sp.]|nr:6-bladed beta-propeller [Telluria sp.]